MSDSEDLRVVVPQYTDTPKADDRGRVNLGSEYANKRVHIAVLEVVDESTEDEE